MRIPFRNSPEISRSISPYSHPVSSNYYSNQLLRNTYVTCHDCWLPFCSHIIVGIFFCRERIHNSVRKWNILCIDDESLDDSVPYLQIAIVLGPAMVWQQWHWGQQFEGTEGIHGHVNGDSQTTGRWWVCSHLERGKCNIVLVIYPPTHTHTHTFTLYISSLPSTACYEFRVCNRIPINHHFILDPLNNTLSMLKSLSLSKLNVCLWWVKLEVYDFQDTFTHHLIYSNTSTHTHTHM